MKTFNVILAVFMSLVLLFSTNLKSFITINYLLNKAEITELFCINKEKPKLECNGKCHLAKEIKKVDVEEEKKPLLPIPTSKQHHEVLYVEVSSSNKISEIIISNKQHYSPINAGEIQHGYFLLITPPPKQLG
ncbi:MAG: hypothetical protein OQJ96_10345 [Flavobacteriales bacterium]|nr:hypothetical protein [Flavobacteriales bacterium]MCW8913430.1 hypothetical protein [Flavobacteriales bacterium]MCW8938506.1 hypothetical protein [Flavobacteriales bacterium]MCW8941364.1 hypothetical protein [Flavobacteriales bacterium]MCW8967475.1 hypothetical protein [Flavobacteriales bacterium]